MHRSCPGRGGGGLWAQLELTDAFSARNLSPRAVFSTINTCHIHTLVHSIYAIENVFRVCIA